MNKINWEDKKVKIAVICVISLVSVILLFSYFRNNNFTDGPALPTDLPDRSAEVKEEEKTDTPVTTKPSTTAPKLTYQQALVKYADKRIQFDTECRAVPNNMGFKNGTSIMLDNRANVSRKIKVGSVYTVPAYDFKIVKLSSTTLPATWLVDCGASQNVATILIQK